MAAAPCAQRGALIPARPPFAPIVYAKATAKAAAPTLQGWAPVEANAPAPALVPAIVPAKALPIVRPLVAPLALVPVPMRPPGQAGANPPAALRTWSKAESKVAPPGATSAMVPVQPIKTEAKVSDKTSAMAKDAVIVAKPETLEQTEKPAEPLPESMQRKLREWWQRVQGSAKPGPEARAQRREQERARLKADLAQEERGEELRRKEANKRLSQDQAFLRCVAAGRLLALDLTANLRDCRMLASLGSADALREALAELLLTLRRARGLCSRLREDQSQLDQDFESQRKQQEEAGRQRRLALIRRMAKLSEAETEAAEPEPTVPAQALESLTAGGVPLLAELAHQASVDGLDLEAVGSKAVGPELRTAQEWVQQLRELLAQAGLNQPPVKRRRPEQFNP